MANKTAKSNIFASIPAEIVKKKIKVAQPTFIQPMLATLTKNYFSSNDWIYEHKFDGERCIAFKKNGTVNLKSRNDKNMNAQYPELIKALEAQAVDNFIIDGEVVALGKNGVSDFGLLQGRMNLRHSAKIAQKQTEYPIVYCIFDLVYIDGYDIREFPLSYRKDLLLTLLEYNEILSYTEHKQGDGIPLFKQACASKWEGLIAKKYDSEYVGVRSPYWLKFKCYMQQELVIGGYTTAQGSRGYFGALLVGYYQDGKLIYAGKVGTGYSEATLALLGKKLQKITTNICPFNQFDDSTNEVHWVKPILVAEFQFAQWTAGGKLRVGRYKGLRDDKDAKDVVKEVPKSIGFK